MKFSKRAVAETLITLALIGAFMYFSLRATNAGAQYGNPYDPYLDYQRQQREIEDLEIQRRQLEIQEMRQIWLWTAPVPQIVDPWDPAFQAEPL